MIRIISLFAIFFCFGLTFAFAQEDAYDEYLNGKKKKTEKSGRVKDTGKRQGAIDYRDRYLQDAGASFYWFDVNTVFGPATIALPGINYVGRLVINKNPERIGLSVGTHPSLGLQFGNFASYFLLSVPLMFEGTIGLGSNLNNDAPIGAFVGLGPEYNLARSWGEFALPFRVDQLSITGSAGLRFRIRDRAYYLRYSESFGSTIQGQYFRSIAFGNSLF